MGAWLRVTGRAGFLSISRSSRVKGSRTQAFSVSGKINGPKILHVQEVITHFNSNLLFEMGHYFLDRQ